MKQIKITSAITPKTSIITKYFNDIKKEPLLTSEEETNLMGLVKKGDVKAQNQLIKSNLRFVISVAKQYQNQGVPLADLINEGNLGLIKSAMTFDETKGFKFISYAVWWIRQSILQALSEQSRIVRLPNNRVYQISQINKIVSEFEQKNERQPSASELSEILNIQDVSLLNQLSLRHVSLDSVINDDDEDVSLIDLIPDNTFSPTESVDHQSLKTDLNRLIATLTPTEQTVIKCFFGIDEQPLSLTEIGAKLKLSKERIRQIKEKALSKLRYNTNLDLLKPYI